MTTFWTWFVAAGTIAFVIWCVWLIGWAAKQGPQNKEDEDLVGHKWDGDLEEWNNPAPKWWLYLYFITIVWGIGYMLAGDCPVSNTDPSATAPTKDNQWINAEGPHLMLILPASAGYEGVPTDPYSGKPYVMWKDSPYVHIMVPTAGN